MVRRGEYSLVPRAALHTWFELKDAKRGQARINLDAQMTRLFFLREDKCLVVHLLLRKLFHIDISLHLKNVHGGSLKNIRLLLAWAGTDTVSLPTR